LHHFHGEGALLFEVAARIRGGDVGGLGFGLEIGVFSEAEGFAVEAG